MFRRTGIALRAWRVVEGPAGGRPFWNLPFRGFIGCRVPFPASSSGSWKKPSGRRGSAIFVEIRLPGSATRSGTWRHLAAGALATVRGTPYGRRLSCVVFGRCRRRRAGLVWGLVGGDRHARTDPAHHVGH